MIRSMTGTASCELETELFSVGMEIRTYNSRYLDIQLKMPQGYQKIEEFIRKNIGERVARGRVEIRIWVKPKEEEGEVFILDEARAASYYQVLNQLKHLLGIQKEIPLELIAHAGGIITAEKQEEDMNALLPVISQCLENTLDDLEAMRDKEGENLKEDMENRLLEIEKTLFAIEESAQYLADAYMERLMERISRLTRNIVEADPDRIAQEAAIIADKSDITEEVIRAKSHLAMFREIVPEPEPSGRKLNFLLQECNREFNTMGVKAQNSDISHKIVFVKSELEKIREQVQNVE